MPKLVIDSIDDVDEHLRDFYKEGDDGKFRLQVDDLDQHYEAKDAVENLRKVNASERKRATELEKKLASFKDIDPERYQALIKEHEERERKIAEGKGEFDKLERQIREHYEKQLETERSEKKQLATELDNAVIEDGLMRALHAHKALAGAESALMPVLRPRMKLTRDDNGKVRALVLDEDGNPAIRIEDGKPQTADDLVAKLKTSDVWGRLFEGNTKKGVDTDVGAGSGAGGGGNGHEAYLNKPLKDWKQAEKVDFITKHGSEEFSKLVAKSVER